MQRYLLICIFIQLTIFTSDLLAEETDMLGKQRQCVGAVQSDLPPPLQRIGVSNINVRNIPRNIFNRFQDYMNLSGRFNLYEFYFYVGEQFYQIKVKIEKPKYFNPMEVEDGIEILNEVFVSDQVVLERLRQVLDELPVSAFQEEFSLYLYRNKRGSVIGGYLGGSINLYSPLELFLEDQYTFNGTLYTIRHEIGHVIYETLSIRFRNRRLRPAVLADANEVSEYSEYRESIAEDFAEAMRIYLESNGGLYHPELLDKFSNRFAVLDEVMGVTPDQRKQINERTYNF